MSEYRRDWLKEAYKICNGDRSITLKKEHLVATMEALIGIKKDAEKLRSFMKQVHAEATKQRQVNGQ